MIAVGSWPDEAKLTHAHDLKERGPTSPVAHADRMIRSVYLIV
jgi:hypothetical protein